jgi:8-oxo-dGTP diphosphatase
MKPRKKIPAPILAAGGIVVREAPEPRIAIVRLRKNKAWVLPKGKLKAGEDALAAARREVMEETGHEVSVHEYLGEMAEAPGARPKTVQFWRMQANGKPTRKLMRDVKAVKWLPFERAVETLTHPHERAFLEQVRPALDSPARAPAAPTIAERIRDWLRHLTHSPA